MSKFFVMYSERDYGEEVVEQLFDDVQSAVDYGINHAQDDGNQHWHYFDVYEVSDTKVERATMRIQVYSYDLAERYTDWMDENQFSAYQINQSRNRSIARGDIAGWNEHVLKNNFGEEYLIK